MALFNPKRLSCGVVVLNAQRELLLCHVTGQQHWDLPKGGINPGESALEAALRETREETGLRLDADTLLELGRFDYRPRKDLHLFAALLPRIDVSTLHCDSHFSELNSGRRMPEMDDFAWFDFAEAPRRCSGKMAAVIAGRLDLSRLLERLVAQPPVMVRPARRVRVDVGEALSEVR